MEVKQQFKEAQAFIANRQMQEALDIYNAIMEANPDTEHYFWALKHVGDVVGYIGYRDYFQSIDIYQRIITEYEGEDDGLYEMAQLDVARAYLELGLEMIANFDNTIHMYEPQSEQMIEYQQSLREKRNAFIEEQAEVIYKERM